MGILDGFRRCCEIQWMDPAGDPSLKISGMRTVSPERNEPLQSEINHINNYAESA